MSTGKFVSTGICILFILSLHLVPYSSHAVDGDDDHLFMTSVEIWDNDSRDVDTLDPSSFYRIVFKYDTEEEVPYINISGQHQINNSTYSITDVNGTVYDSGIIVEDDIFHDRGTGLVSVPVRLDDYMDSGSWNMTIDIGLSNSSYTPWHGNFNVSHTSKITPVAVVKDWGEIHEGEELSYEYVFDVESNGAWNMTIDSGTWISGEVLNVSSYTIDNSSFPVYKEGEGETQITFTLSLSIPVNSSQVGDFENEIVLSIPHGEDISVLMEVTIPSNSSTARDVRKEFHGRIIMDDSGVPNQLVRLEIAIDSRFQLIERVEVTVTDRTGYFITHLNVTEGEFLRATVRISGEEYISDVVQVRSYIENYTMNIIVDTGNVLDTVGENAVPIGVGIGIMSAIAVVVRKVVFKV